MRDGPQPTFSLPNCPRCSSRLGGGDAPFWKYAHNTSEKRRRNCYFFMGCRHAEEVAKPDKIYDDPEEWSLVEDAWREHRERMFADMTATMTDVERARLRATIDGKSYLVGATEPLDLSPAHPAQQEPNERHENGS